MTKTQTHNARRTKSLSQDAAMLVGIGVFTIAVLGAVFAFTASNQQAAAIDVSKPLQLMRQSWSVRTVQL